MQHNVLGRHTELGDDHASLAPRQRILRESKGYTVLKTTEKSKGVTVMSSLRNMTIIRQQLVDVIINLKLNITQRMTNQDEDHQNIRVRAKTAEHTQGPLSCLIRRV